MKKLILIISTLLFAGCAYSSGGRNFAFGYVYPYQSYYTTNPNPTGYFHHEWKKNQMRKELERQRMQLRELQMQDEIRFNEQLIERERIRQGYHQ